MNEKKLILKANQFNNQFHYLSQISIRNSIEAFFQETKSLAFVKDSYNYKNYICDL